MASLPSATASYAISIRRASVSESLFVRLPACGFLQPTPHGVNLAVRLAVPLAGPAEDLHLQVLQLVTTTSRIVPVTALRAMPGTPIKKQGHF